ncbi:MAG TPA: hypothetical protein VIA11_21960 [Acidimicrobiia bacterium]|jgi:2-polyprenyl-6-methoxyphenol hydroxylase-like FAD-dependent oxidoreductase|nr:hypothetical protein [Acidimicrobiia bacterium]
MAARTPRVIVIGAGIGGLVTALSIHEIGTRVDVYERVRRVEPLGVGINLLPHAVRELDALGILAPLRQRSVEPTSLVYCSRHGREIWSEPRGIAAGYPWPQLSVHRGALQEVLLDAFHERVGREHLHLGHRLLTVDADAERACAVFDARPDEGELVVAGDAVVAVTASTASRAPSGTRPRVDRAGAARSSGAGSPRSSRCSTVAR